MRKNLVNEQQPFGQKFDSPMHNSTLATPKGMVNRPGATTANGNNGRTLAATVDTGTVPGTMFPVSFNDPNPNAYEQACKGRDNPFGPVGKNFGTGRVNLTEFPTNAN